MDIFGVFKVVMCVLCIFFLQSCQNKVEGINTSDLTQAASYNVQLGLSYLKQGARPRAKKKLLLALKQAPDSPEVHGAIAYYFEQTHEMEQAKNHYIKAIFLSSNGGAELNNYGAFLCRQGAYNQSLDYFLKAVKDEQYIHTSGAYENAGLCALAIPDKKKAKLFFIEALNQDPSRRQSLYELVKLEHRRGHEVYALNQLKKYPQMVLNDKLFLPLAKQIAKKTGDTAYFNLLSKTKSGVYNDYSTDHG